MKTILILVSTIFLFSSCNKKYCWECEGEYNGTTIKNIVCGKTASEIKEVEAGGVYKCTKAKKKATYCWTCGVGKITDGKDFGVYRYIDTCGLSKEEADKIPYMPEPFDYIDDTLDYVTKCSLSR